MVLQTPNNRLYLRAEQSEARQVEAVARSYQPLLSLLHYMGLIDRTRIKLEIQRVVNSDDRRGMPILAALAIKAFFVSTQSDEH